MSGRRPREFLAAVCAAAVWSGCDRPSLPQADPVTTTIVQPPATTRPAVITTTTVEPVATTGPSASTTTTVEQRAPTSTSRPPSSATPTSTTLVLPIDGPLVDLRGEPTYLHGANLPWFNFGCDFGCGPDGGASSTEVRTAVNEVFARADFAGMSIVRWWLMPGAPTQIRTDAEGLPTDIDPVVFTDIDAALDLAEQYGIDVVFTLFSAPSALPPIWLDNETGRTRLAATLSELFERYADDPRVHTWQVLNEPEWDIWNGAVDESDVRELVSEIAAAVHRTAATQVSVGSARLDGLAMWVGTGLDYYTVHWYDPMENPESCVLCTTYGAVDRAVGLDAPLVVGEFYAGEDLDDAQGRFQGFVDRGYAGAWAWSLLPERTDDGYAIDHAAAARFGFDLLASQDDSTADG